MAASGEKRDRTGVELPGRKWDDCVEEWRTLEPVEHLNDIVRSNRKKINNPDA
jgi:hypothetical protein